MPKSQATIGYGTTLEIALADDPNTFVYIAETKSHTPPSFTDDTVDVTHMASPNRMREYISTLSDPGESSHEMNYIPGSPTDTFLSSIQGKRLVTRLTFTNGRQMIYSAYRSGYEREIPLDEGIGATLTLKVSGEPVLTAPSAPRSLAAPAIEGTPKVGVPLIADSGVWAGASELEYQWQVDGADVPGATASSYVPTVADVGSAVQVEITASNGDFETVLVSTATANVAA